MLKTGYILKQIIALISLLVVFGYHCEFTKSGNACTSIEKNYPVIKTSEYPGGHTWPVWRNNLYNFTAVVQIDKIVQTIAI